MARVLIIGAGFAGLKAARELEAAGIEVEIFEARDRVGGRAWTDQRMDRPLEMGATWVHWFQPHVWPEIQRYGLSLVASPDYDRAYWKSQGQVHEGAEADLDALLARPQAKIFDGSREFFPRPFDPLYVLRDDYDGPADVLLAEGSGGTGQEPFGPKTLVCPLETRHRAAAALVGGLASRGGDRAPLPTVATMVLGNLVIYAFGLGYLMWSLHLGLGGAWEIGMKNYLLGDALKIALAAGVLPGAWRLVDALHRR